VPRHDRNDDCDDRSQVRIVYRGVILQLLCVADDVSDAIGGILTHSGGSASSHSRLQRHLKANECCPR
jgi:hypothetical protein